VYLQRKLVLHNGDEIKLPAPNPADFQHENIEIITEVGLSMLVNDMVLISGEVARTSESKKDSQSITLNRTVPGSLIRRPCTTNTLFSMCAGKDC
jgi:hypothetical protein